MKMTDRLWTALAGALVLCAVTGPTLAQPGMDRPVPVIVYEASLEPFADRVEALGTLRANESVELTAPVADTITALNFEDGARVSAGDVLAEMTNAEEQAALDEAQASASEAWSQYERVRDLAERGSATRSTLDERRREYETARARLEATRSRLQDRLIVAPFDGIVGLRNISAGAYVSPGTVITTLNDDTVMKLDFSIPEVNLTAIEQGQAIEAQARALPGEIFPGHIATIDASIDTVTRSVRVRALLPNEDRRLRPGMLMTVEIVSNEREAVLIPEEAIILEGRETFTWVVGADETSVERRVLTTGGRQPGVVEITSGLEPGELVVTRGGNNLRPGAHVTIRARDTGDDALSDMLSRGE